MTVDHEHPCPTARRCIINLQRAGYPITGDVECCICWLREFEDTDNEAPTVALKRL